jgi:hypothetical protein
MFTLIPCGYPAGKGKDKDFYPLYLTGKGTKEIDGYANKRVNVLPLPYPAIAIPTTPPRRSCQTVGSCCKPFSMWNWNIYFRIRRTEMEILLEKTLKFNMVWEYS